MPTPSGTISMLDVANQLIENGSYQATSSAFWENNYGIYWDYNNLEADAAAMPSSVAKDGTVTDGNQADPLGYYIGISFNDVYVRVLADTDETNTWSGTADALANPQEISMSMMQNKPLVDWTLSLTRQSSAPAYASYWVWNVTTGNGTVIVNDGAGFDIVSGGAVFQFYYDGTNSVYESGLNSDTSQTYTIDDGSEYVIVYLRALTHTGITSEVYGDIVLMHDNMTSTTAESNNIDYMKFTTIHSENDKDYSSEDDELYLSPGPECTNCSANDFVSEQYDPTYGDEIRITITRDSSTTTSCTVSIAMHDTS